MSGAILGEARPEIGRLEHFAPKRGQGTRAQYRTMLFQRQLTFMQPSCQRTETGEYFSRPYN
jgi:hypothetical protein